MDIESAFRHIENYNIKKLNSIDFKDPYLKSYPNLLNASKSLLENLKEDSILPISHLAYAWMTTILTYNKENLDIEVFEKTICSATSVKNQYDAIELLDVLPETSPINNSWIGLSKVLHFINPDLFPIWDSRVAACFEKFNAQGYNKKNIYMNYCHFIFQYLDFKKVQSVKSIHEKKANYSISSIRALEFLLFSLGREILKERAEKKQVSKK